ncbi:hypothetical protein P3339_18965 [Microbulbifer sp. MLAF003]|uniref:hypothetical protein n=1 Tax=Microbulbifer sp. MLAF003 TaxID=3032582 RepID=UPI0024AD5F4C|nr:hypothetical protein [Microbulbifer sp. MLAF003]WHI50498.1 hypothetical protein P3339_18965 [Microbulbifer sp. MLAF003]
MLVSISSTTLAASDSQSSDIELKFNATIDIDGVENISIEDPALDTDATGGDGFCVGGFGFSTFSITFESNDGKNDDEFSLINSDESQKVTYSVGFDNSTSGSFTNVTEGAALGNQTRKNASCTGTDNARFQITVANDDWQTPNVLDGTSYTDTLLITVASE